MKESTWEIKFEKILEVYGEKGERIMGFSSLDLPIAVRTARPPVCFLSQTIP